MCARILLPLVLLFACSQAASAGMIAHPADTPAVTGSLSMPLAETPDEHPMWQPVGEDAGMAVTPSSAHSGSSAAAVVLHWVGVAVLATGTVNVTDAPLPACPFSKLLLKPS